MPMKLLLILLAYVLNLQSEFDLFKIQKVFLLENKFWSSNQEQIKTDKGYLYRVNIDIGRESGFTTGFYYYSETCYYLKSTNLGYVVLKYSVIEEDITSFLKSPEIDKFLLKFCFLFTDKPINCNCFRCFEKCKGKIKEYVAYKLPKKISENIISLEWDVSNDIRMKYLKENLKEFVIIMMKLLNFNEYSKNFGEKNEKQSKIKQNENFELFYFKNYSRCIENLKKFKNKLCYFNLQKDDAYNSFTDMKSTLKVAQFQGRIYENLRKLNDNETDKICESLLNRYFNFIKNEMLKNNILLPIGGQYNIDYYIEQISNLIYESAREEQIESFFVNSKDINFISFKISNSLKHNLEQLQFCAVKDLCEFEYIPKHFVELLGREIETLDDYINVENIICDYYNMFAFIFNLYHEFKNVPYVSYTYFPPILIENYNLRIIDGIEIKLKIPAEFEQIKGFNNKGEEVIMVKDSDYFIDILGVFYCPSKVLEMKNIYEIEIISFDDVKNYMRFKVNEYLVKSFRVEHPCFIHRLFTNLHSLIVPFVLRQQNN